MRGHADSAALGVGLVDKDEPFLSFDGATQLSQAVARAHVIRALHTVSGGPTEEHDHRIRGINERFESADVRQIVHVQKDAQSRNQRAKLRLDAPRLILTA